MVRTLQHNGTNAGSIDTFDVQHGPPLPEFEQISLLAMDGISGTFSCFKVGSDLQMLFGKALITVIRRIQEVQSGLEKCRPCPAFFSFIRGTVFHIGMVFIAYRILISAALYLFAFVASSQAAGGGSRRHNRGKALYKGVNTLRCGGQLPEDRPLHWPRFYSFNPDKSIQSFCAANQHTLNTVGCYCQGRNGQMKCREKFAHPELHKPPMISFCHENCKCEALDEEPEGKASSELSMSEIDSLIDDLKDFSMEDSGMADWALIDAEFDDEEASSSNQQQPQSPDVIAAMAAAISTSMEPGTCLAGPSSQPDPFCDDTPAPTCSGTSCTNYYECEVEDDSASSSVNPIISNNNNDCPCLVNRPDLDQGGKDDYFFIGKCGNRKGGRRRDGGLASDDLCLCNSTFVSTACCHVRDGMVWETADLKRSVRLLG